MKNHHFLALGACALALTQLPTAARADAPAPSADKRPDGRHGKPGEHPGKPGDEAKAEKDHQGEHGRPDADGGKPGGRGDGFRGAMRQLREDLKDGKLKKGDLKDKLAKLRESSAERGKVHRQELGKRWGGTLALPAARDELKNHARRMAFLDRAMVLAETEAKDKDKLTDRISKLIDKENERHERAMERFKSMPLPATAAPGAAPSAVPAPAAAPAG
jgi:hypothetical protein